MTDLKITEAITVQFPMVQFRARVGRSRLQDGKGRPQGAPLQAAALRISRQAAINACLRKALDQHLLAERGEA
ncbi:MAG: hypothetical protein OXH93_15350 [Caldilineaceae bacterium]|nr:hypothetical protein [Caldilineaceae bacterium]